MSVSVSVCHLGLLCFRVARYLMGGRGALTWIVLADAHVGAELGDDVLVVVAFEEAVAPGAAEAEVEAVGHGWVVGEEKSRCALVVGRFGGERSFTTEVVRGTMVRR